MNDPQALQQGLNLTDRQMVSLQAGLAARRCTSLDRRAQGDGDEYSTLAELIADDRPDYLDSMDLRLAAESLEQAINTDADVEMLSIASDGASITDLSEIYGAHHTAVRAELTASRQRARERWGMELEVLAA